MKWVIRRGVRGMVKNLVTKFKKYDHEATQDLEFTEGEKSFQYSQNGFIAFIRRGLKSGEDWVFVVREDMVSQKREWNLGKRFFRKE